MDLYRDIILDQYHHPVNRGHLSTFTVSVDQKNATCGDSIHVELLISDTGTYLTDVKYEITGCAISIAAASLVSEDLKGKSLDEILLLPVTYITDMLGTTLTPTRVKCALLFLSSVKKAILTLEQH